MAAVVPRTDAGNQTVSEPRTLAKDASYDPNVASNVPTMPVGETWFGLVALGSDRKSPRERRGPVVRLERTS